MITHDMKIQTERLILRPFNEQDCDAMFRIQGNPVMTRYTPDEPWKSIEEAYGFINLATRLYNNDKINDGFRYFFAVVEAQSNNVIGYCGLGGPEFDRTLTEVFYGIEYSYWGKGYATETTKALLEYGFINLMLDKIVGFADKDNIASLRVLEKAGLKRIGIISGLEEKYKYFNGECLYQIDKISWEADK
jgi:ribosomal-protein-alanine N-acetyltransferase